MVQIDNLSFCYKRKKIFEQLNLVMPTGYIYGLLGKNGSGKSTLLKLISGLLFPGNGKITVAGFEPKDRFPKFLQEVYIVTEEFYLPSQSMDAYVKLYAPFYPRFNSNHFQEYIREFELPSDQKLSSLSYGQKKKFLLSFGLATDCKLLILDEPTNGLDIPSKSQFRKVVASAINEERSFIISTHQIRDMENLIDPVIILDEGEIAFFQNLENISHKITIGKEKEIHDKSGVLYYESSLGGFTVVKENIEGLDSRINLETLFTAVVNNKERFNHIFNRL